MRPRARRAGGLSLPGRLLRLERRRGAMLRMLPLVAALGFAMRFPAVVNAAAASVPPVNVGAPAGTNNAMRGVFGFAALAAVPVTAPAPRQHRSPTGSSPRHGSGAAVACSDS